MYRLNLNLFKNRINRSNTWRFLIVKVEEDSDNVDPLDTFQVPTYDSTLGNMTIKMLDFEIFPNPVSEVIFIETADKVDVITIYTMLGQGVLCFTETQINVINLSSM